MAIFSNPFTTKTKFLPFTKPTSSPPSTTAPYAGPPAPSAQKFAGPPAPAKIQQARVAASTTPATNSYQPVVSNTSQLPIPSPTQSNSTAFDYMSSFEVPQSETSPLSSLYGKLPDQTSIQSDRQAYLDTLGQSPEQIATQNQLSNLQASYKLGAQKNSDQTIPMDLITGQNRSLLNQEQIQEQTLNQKLANLQTQRQGQQQQAQAKLDFTDRDIQGFLDAQKDTQYLNDKQKAEANDVLKFALDNFSGTPVNDIISHPTTLNYLQQLSTKAGIPVGVVLKALQKAETAAADNKDIITTTNNAGDLTALDKKTGQILWTQKGVDGARVGSGGVGGPVKLTSGQKTSLADANTVLDSIADIRNKIVGVNTGLTAGLQNRLASTGNNPTAARQRAAAAEGAMQQLSSNFMKAISGGTVPIEEVARLRKFLPSINDQESTIQWKLAQLENYLRSQVNNIYDVSGGGSSSVDDILNF